MLSGRIHGMAFHRYRLFLLRHGETEWSLSGQHTGRTEVQLTENGRAQAKEAEGVLNELHLFDPLVISSPRQRAIETAELAGLTINEVSPLIAEWDYGEYEGVTTKAIREAVPDWLVFTHGCPGGESVAQVSDRADRAIAMATDHLDSRDVVFVSHGHFSRSVITRWVELPLVEGTRFGMRTASIAICGFEHGIRQLAALGLTGESSLSTGV
jgi:broad specificity phosphatase PhoE